MSVYFFLKPVTLLLVVAFHIQENFGECDYYWRNFNKGDIPPDAYTIIAEDSSGTKTNMYFGNAIGYEGMTYVGAMIEGVNDLSATHHDPNTGILLEPQKYNSLIKILCATAKTSKLEAVLVNSDNVTNFIDNYEPVIGGAELHRTGLDSTKISTVVPLYLGFANATSNLPLVRGTTVIGQVFSRPGESFHANRLVYAYGNGAYSGNAKEFYMLGCHH